MTARAPAAAGLLCFVSLLALAPGLADAKPVRPNGAAHPAAVGTAQTPDRATFTAPDRARAEVPGFADIRFDADDPDGFRRARPTAEGPWLAFSAGGADGAFGAGLVHGLRAQDATPPFAMVTGASTGALLATLTFIGAPGQSALKDGYTGITAADVFEIGATPESLVDAWPLKRMIEQRVSPQLVAAVAREHAAGRRLFVLTTDMDAGQTIVWNMGAIAARGGPQALDLFRKVLVASSAIPGMFQPVYIASKAGHRTITEMHADGSIARPFYALPTALVMGAARAGLPVPDIYVVVNGKLDPGFDQVDKGVLTVLGRSFGLALAAGERAQIADLSNFAQRNGTRIEVAAIPQTFDKRAKGAFDPDYMGALFAAGEQAARTGSAFADATVPEHGSVRADRER